MSLADDATVAWRAVVDGYEQDKAAELADLTARLEQAVRDLADRAGVIGELQDQIVALQARIAELEAGEPEQPVDPEAPYRPVRYADLAQARAALGAPEDANYVLWNHGDRMLQQVFASLGPNDILVLPEREQPYLIDSSRGFMAGGVKEVDGPDGTRLPIYGSDYRAWFSMCRSRRGIIGLGPGVVIEPSASSFSQPRQPVPQKAYFTNGGEQVLSGAQHTLIETEHPRGFYGNFTLRGRDLGGVAYSGITGTQFVRVYADGCWRGFAGVPNGETGGFKIGGTTAYRVESCTLRSEGGPSPIMWNSSVGGVMRHVKVTAPNVGMPTFWYGKGVNTWEDVHIAGRQILLNIEQPAAGFSLTWVGGSASIIEPLGYHVNGNPANGSYKVALRDVAISGGRNPGSLTAHVYTTYGVQKKSDITADVPVVCYSGMI